MPSKYKVWCDGACSGNPGPGAWAFLVVADGFEGDDGRFHASGTSPDTTNQRMELQAIIEALAWIVENGNEPFNLTVLTDSTYLKNGVTSWLANWKSNGWLTRTNEPVKNRDLWERIDQLVAGLSIEWVWTEGHADDENNKFVDKLAVKAVKLLKKEKKAGKRFIVLIPLRGTKRTSALVDNDMCVCVFDQRSEAESEAKKKSGHVVDAETLEPVG